MVDVCDDGVRYRERNMRLWGSWLAALPVGAM